MEREIKEKLEEVVALLNDPEETVMDKEIKVKLEKILALLNDPSGITMAKEELQARLDTVVELVNKASADPDIEIEYQAAQGSDDPHILVTYVVSEYNKPTRKITLKETVLSRNTPEDLANQITFAIEEFKGDIDSVGMG